MPTIRGSDTGADDRELSYCQLPQEEVPMKQLPMMRATDSAFEYSELLARIRRLRQLEERVQRLAERVSAKQVSPAEAKKLFKKLRADWSSLLQARPY